MKDTVNILEGSTFVTSDQRGDINGTPTTPHGLFALDTRFLSGWSLTADGKPLTTLSVDDVAYNEAQFFLAATSGSTYVDAPMSMIRRRTIGADMRERIEVMNHTSEPRALRLVLQARADFADLFEVKDDAGEDRRAVPPASRRRGDLGYKRDEFRRETYMSAPAGRDRHRGVADLPTLRWSPHERVDGRRSW